MAVLTQRQFSRRRKWVHLICDPSALFLIGLVLLVGGSAKSRAAETGVTREYDLKAAFLFNFVQFVEWPTNAFATSNSPIVIGILGDDPFGRSLEEMVANETVGIRKVMVKRIREVSNSTECQVLFINETDPRRLDRALESLADRSVLTVSDDQGLRARNVVIQFVRVQNKLRLKIDVAAAKAARLTISSKLLRQAELIGNGNAP